MSPTNERNSSADPALPATPVVQAVQRARAVDDGAQSGDRQLHEESESAARKIESGIATLLFGTESTPQPGVVTRILEAATSAVADCGLNGLSMDDVAIRAGCSRATVYRRVGGKDVLRDAVLDEAIGRISASVAASVADLVGDDRLVQALRVSLQMIRADPVSAALLTGPAAGRSVSSALITQVTDTIALLTGLDAGNGVACELFARVTLSLLCWPGADGDTELAIIRHYVYAQRPRGRCSNR